MNVLARAGVCWLVLACFSMTAPICQAAMSFLYTALEIKKNKLYTEPDFSEPDFSISLFYNVK